VLQQPQFIDRFVKLFGMGKSLFGERFAARTDIHKGFRAFKARGITQAGRFRQLLFESYSRLFTWNQACRKAYEDL
jgi:hypothetical protein